MPADWPARGGARRGAGLARGYLKSRGRFGVFTSGGSWVVVPSVGECREGSEGRVSWPCAAAAPAYGPARPGGEEPGMSGARRCRRAGPCSASPVRSRCSASGRGGTAAAPGEEPLPPLRPCPLLAVTLSPWESSRRACLLPSRPEAIPDLGGCRGSSRCCRSLERKSHV